MFALSDRRDYTLAQFKHFSFACHSNMVCTVGIEALQAPACYKLRKRLPFRSGPVSGKARCLTVQAVKLRSVDEPVSRRQALQGLAMLAATGAIPQQALAAGKSAEVGRSVDANSPDNRVISAEKEVAYRSTYSSNFL